MNQKYVRWAYNFSDCVSFLSWLRSNLSLSLSHKFTSFKRCNPMTLSICDLFWGTCYIFDFVWEPGRNRLVLRRRKSVYPFFQCICSWSKQQNREETKWIYPCMMRAMPGAREHYQVMISHFCWQRVSSWNVISSVWEPVFEYILIEKSLESIQCDSLQDPAAWIRII